MKNRLLFIPAGVIVVTLLLVGTFCDLQVSQAIVHLDNGFSHFMAGFTAVPLGVILGFILGTFFKMVKNHEYKKRWQNILLCVVSFVGLIVGAYAIGRHFTSYHAYNLSDWFSVLFGVIPVVPGYLLGYYFYDRMKKEHVIKTYLLIAIAILVVILTIEGLKLILPRLRYTSVTILGDEWFHPWYNPDFSLNKEFAQGLVDAEEIKSFPSGHSNIGMASAFALMFIPKFFPKFKDKEVYFFYGGFIFFLLVAFARILIGAHYLSDTMFAGTLALFVYFISNEIYLRKVL